MNNRKAGQNPNSSTSFEMFESRVIDELKARARAINEWSSPHFILHESDETGYDPTKRDVERFLAKSLFYSDRIVVISPKTQYGRCFPSNSYFDDYSDPEPFNLFGSNSPQLAAIGRNKSLRDTPPLAAG